MEKRKFEEAFHDAFKDAEANPSEIVWTNIELELEKAQGGKMKRRLLFFQTLAAASIVFAIMVGGIGYYFLKDSSDVETIANQSNSKNTPSETLSEQKAPESNEIKEKVSPADKDNSSSLNSKEDKRELLAQKIKDAQTEDAQKNNARAGQTPKATPQHGGSLPTEQKIVSGAHPNSNTKTENMEKERTGNSLVENEIASTRPENNVAGKTGSIRTPQKDATAIDNRTTNNELTTSNLSTNNQPTLLDDENNKGNLLTSKSDGQVRSLPPFFKMKDPTLKIENSQPDPGALLIARIAAEQQQYAMQDKEQEKNKSEKLWTSVGFAAGAFNSLNPSISPMPSNSLYYNANASNTAAKQSKASGVAYSVGVNVGAKLSKRWVLQGGVNYLTQSSDYTANSVVVDNNFQSPQAESINVYKAQVQLTADAANQKVAPTVPYTVNNNVQFLSIPVQAGYLFVNRKFGLQLNAGVSTDMFLQNTISPEAGGISRTTQGRGADSPYRSLNFSGLMGTEFSYKLGSRYRVAVNPGLRYPFNSVYKTNTGVESTPLTFDVGLRFRYIFH